MLFGPSMLGNKNILGQALFPVKGVVVVEKVASFGLMFFFFICCVKMNISTLMKIEKLAITVAISVFALTLVIPTGLAILLRKYATMDRSLAQALPFMALSQQLT